MNVILDDFKCSVTSRDELTWKILFPALSLQTRKPKPRAEEACPGPCVWGCPVLALEEELPEGSERRPPLTPPEQEGRAPGPKHVPQSSLLQEDGACEEPRAQRLRPGVSLRGHSGRMGDAEPRDAQGRPQDTSTP